MKLIKQRIKQGISTVMALLLLFLPVGMTAKAMSSTPTVTTSYIGITYTGSQPGYNTWGEVDMIMADGEPVFCMDPLTAVANGQAYNTGEFKAGAFYNARGHKLTDAQVAKVKNIIFWSWDMATSKTNQRYAAVQLMIWEALGTTINTLNGISWDDYAWYKNELAGHTTATVSFNGESHTFTPGQSKTLTDNNGNLKYLSFKNQNGWSFSQSGNSVTVTAGNNATDYKALTENRQLYKKAKTNLILKKDGAQTLVAFRDPDRLKATLNLSINKKGFLSWTKVAANTGTSLSGTKWTVQEWNKDQGKYVDYANQNVSYYSSPQPHYGITWSGAFATDWLTATDKNEGWFRVVEKTAQTGYINNGAIFEANILKAFAGYDYTFKRGANGEGIALKKTDIKNNPQPGFLAWRKLSSTEGTALKGTKWKVQEWSTAKNAYVDMAKQPSITFYGSKMPEYGINWNGSFATGWLNATKDNQGWFKVVETTAQKGYQNTGVSFSANITRTSESGKYSLHRMPSGKTVAIAKSDYTNTPQPGFITWRKLSSTDETPLKDTKWKVQEWSAAKNAYVDMTTQPSITFYDSKMPEYGINRDGSFATGWLNATKDNQGWFKVVETTAQKGYKNSGVSFSANITRTSDSGKYSLQYLASGRTVAIAKSDYTNTPQPGFLAWQKKAAGSGELLPETQWKVQEWSAAKNVYVDMAKQPTITYYKTAQPHFGLKEGGYFATDWLVETKDNQGWFRIVETKAQEGFVNNGAYFSAKISTAANDNYTVFRTEADRSVAIAKRPLFNGSRGFMMWQKMKSGTKEPLKDTQWKVLEWSKSKNAYRDYKKQDIWFYDKAQEEYGTTEGGYFATDILEFTDDNQGWFKVVETKAQEGFFMDQEISFVANIANLHPEFQYRHAEHPTFGKIAIRTGKALENPQIMGKIAIDKKMDIDKEDTSKKNTPGRNITFTIKDVAGKSVATMTTDDAGHAESEALPYGTYTVSEEASAANAGYKLVEPFTVQINEHGKVYQYELSNELINQKLQIQKVDENGKVVALAGFSFKIKQSAGSFLSQTLADGSKSDTFVTDETGSVTLPQVLASGHYSVVEINTPKGSGFVLNEAELPFEIKDNKDVTLTVSFKNESQKGILKVNKTGEKLVGSTTENVALGGKNYTIVKPVYEARALAGAIFELKAEDGTVVQTLTTDGTNELEFDPVPLGTYYLAETATAEGYVLDSTPQKVVFTAQEQTIRFDIQSKLIHNDRQKIKIDFNKTFEESKWFKRSGVTATFGLLTKADVIGADGKVAIAKDSLLAVALVTKEDGKGSFTDITVTNQLYIKELATHEAYQLHDTNIDVTTDYVPNQDKKTVIEKSVEETVHNELKKIKMELIKVDQSDSKKVIAGAKFKLVAVLDDKTTKEIGEYTTDENGRILVDGLEVGNYRFEEVTPPVEYLPPVNPNTDVEITPEQEHGSTQEITVTNEKKPEIKTTAYVNGKKEIEAIGKVTLTDNVSYHDLLVGKEYEATLVWMDKSTGKPFLVDGKPLTVTKTFVAETAGGEVTLSVEVERKHFVKTTDLVAFETLKKDNIEVAAHKDLTDKDQTVTVHPEPKIKTKATANGEKEIQTVKKVTLTDTITYKDLIVGKEYEATLVWMDKSTGKPFLVDGKPLTVTKTFIAETAGGEVTLSVEVDGKYFTQTVDLVAFESVTRDGIEVAAHMDLTDKDQTVTIKPTPPAKKVPPTGEAGFTGMIAVFALSLVGIGAVVINRKKVTK